MRSLTQSLPPAQTLLVALSVDVGTKSCLGSSGINSSPSLCPELTWSCLSSSSSFAFWLILNPHGPQSHPPPSSRQVKARARKVQNSKGMDVSSLALSVTFAPTPPFHGFGSPAQPRYFSCRTFIPCPPQDLHPLFTPRAAQVGHMIPGEILFPPRIPWGHILPLFFPGL